MEYDHFAPHMTTTGCHRFGGLGRTLIAASAPGRMGELHLKLNANGLTLVQSWLNHPPTNHGLIISGSTSANGFGFASREYPVPEQRPRFTVRFRPRPPVKTTPLPWLHLFLEK